MKQNESRVIQQKRVFLGLATVYKLRDGTTHFRFSPWRIFSILAAGFIIGWITLFSAAFVHFKYRRGYAEASYFETLLFPFTHKSFQKKRGEYYIDTAFDSIDKGDYKKALNLLRNGLIRSPENIRARRTLSEFYEFLFNRPKLAFDLLADGIPFLSSEEQKTKDEYIHYLLAVASRNQLDDKLIEAGNSIQSELENRLSESMKALVNYQIASAYRNIGKIDTAEELLEKKQLYRFSEGLVLQAQLLWDNGQEDLSIRTLETRLSHYNDKRPIYEKIVTLLEEKQHYDKARKYAILYQLEYPSVFQSHLARLQHFYKHNREDQNTLDAFIREYLSEFNKDDIALRQLAILTSKFGDVANTKQVLDKFGEDSSEKAVLLSKFILIEAKIRADRFDEAIESLHQIETKDPEANPLNPDSNSIFLSLKTAAFHGKGNKTEVNQALNKLLESPVIKIDRYLAVAYLFLEVDAPEIALKIMEHCQQTQVYNANVMEALIAIHIQSGDVEQLSKVLTEAIDARRLPNRLLIDSYRLLSSDRNIHVNNRRLVMDKIQNCFSTDYLFKDSQTEEMLKPFSAY